MDFKTFIDALLSGTPIAILVAFIGIVWQVIYTLSRDLSSAKQNKRAMDLEEHKLKLEVLRGSEQLANDITLKLLDVKLSEYEKIWSLAITVTHSNQDAGKINPETTKNVARKIQEWRYSKGGLVANDPARHEVHSFQKELWGYDGSDNAYQRIRVIRNSLRNALRADLGLGERQKVIDALRNLQATSDSSK